MKNSLNDLKTQLSLQTMHKQLSPIIWAKLGYSQIKIDLLSLGVLYSLQFKIGVQHSQLNFCNSLLRLDLVALEKFSFWK